MNWIDKLERKIGRYYISNLMLKVVGVSAVLFFASYFILRDFTLLNYLVLTPSRVLKGEIWRLITFVFIPPISGNVIIIALILYFQYWIGSSLENHLGEFKFNVYFFIGMISEIAIAFITNRTVLGAAITSSLFLAFAKLFPEVKIFIMYIIPVKVKWIGYLTWAGIIGNIGLSLYRRDFSGVLIACTPIINYLIFFGGTNYREGKMNLNAKVRRREYEKSVKTYEKPYKHKCTVCGITDVDDKDMIFRYCSKCEGQHAYCEKHIHNHEHIK